MEIDTRPGQRNIIPPHIIIPADIRAEYDEQPHVRELREEGIRREQQQHQEMLPRNNIRRDANI
jgi:hypothetical protein